MQQKIIQLGKLLVDLLGARPDDDLVSRWMSHYIAEQITHAETTTGKKQKEAQKRCCATILELWKHRAMLPGKARPLQKFEHIFETLQRINPEKRSPFYYNLPLSSKSVSRSEGAKKIDPLNRLLSLVVTLDLTARTLISELLREAAHLATEKKIKTILETAAGLPEALDVNTIYLLRADKKLPTHALNDKLKSRIEKLDEFIELASDYRDSLLDQKKSRNRKE